MVECAPHVLVDAEGLVSAPAETAGEEGGEEADAVDELAFGAGEVQFVKEPVEVEEWGGELVKDEGRGVVVNEWALRRLAYAPLFSRNRGSTYEAKREHSQRRNCMRQHSWTEHFDVLQCDNEIPQEVPRGKTLNAARCAGVTPNSLLPAHVLALLIEEEDP